MSTEPDSLPPRRRPKGDKRARTRSKLILATADLIGEQGYEKTTMAGIAERAGMTTGAIYGNFKNREELFMAVGRVAGAPIVPKIRPGMSFAETLDALADAVIEAIPQRRSAIVGALGFHAYALTHEVLREDLVRVTAEIYQGAAAVLRQRRTEEEMGMTAEQFIATAHALTDGILLHHFLTPDLVPEATIRVAFRALAGAAAKKA